MFNKYQKRGVRTFVGCFAFILQGVLAVQATPLEAGATISLRAAHEPRDAHLLAVTNFNFSAATFSGKLTSKVWADDESNPWGGLTFSYRLVNTSECDDSLGWFSLSGFADLLVDVNYFSGGVAPGKATRSENGDIVSFGFFDRDGEETFKPGSSSAWLIVQTSGHAWGVNQLVGVDAETVVGAAFTPVAVPEPRVVSFLVFAAGAIWFRCRR
jgi:hypothetical protein